MDGVIDVYFEDEIEILAQSEIDKERVFEVLETNSVGVTQVEKVSG